jgi:hypothetical protein
VEDRGIDYELQIEKAPLDCISFNGWNPIFGDEFWASPNYETMVENRLITD